MDKLQVSKTLYWKPIRKWQHTNPTCCALLGNVLCIVSRKANEGDEFHYCSTKVWKWNSRSTNYEYSSLTTYKSKFISIGGYNHLLRVMSNETKVLNIELEYESSHIPPLSSSRWRASSISVKLENTEYLIVAGGHDSNYQNLLSVEVLIENKWVSVKNELPMHCSSLKWALHKNDIYLLSGNNLIHCDWKMLISKPTISMKLWKIMDMGHIPATVVSYGQHLVTIDQEAKVRFHNISLNSWDEVNSKNNNSSIVSDKLAAIAIPVEKLIILAYGDDAIYEIQLIGKNNCT